MIATDSPAYIRRLVREINLSLLAGRSVYSKSYPFNIRVKKVTGGYNIKKVIVTDFGNQTHGCAVDSFFDEQGSIVASRQ